MSNALSRETILKRILSPDVADSYDYVIVDCLPALGILLINALTAADEIIIPVETQKFAIDGLTALTDLYSQIKATINPKLAVPHVLATKVDNTTVSKKALLWLSERFGDAMYNTVIHRSVEAAKSCESGVALCTTKHRLGSEYSSLAKEVVSHDR